MINERFKLLFDLDELVTDVAKEFENMAKLADRMVGIHNRAVKQPDSSGKTDVLTVTEYAISKLVPYTGGYTAQKQSDGTYELRRVGQDEDQGT